MCLRLCVSERARAENPISHPLDYGWTRSKDTPLPLPHGREGRISQLSTHPNLGTNTHNRLPLRHGDRKVQFDLPFLIKKECLLGLKLLRLSRPSVNVDSGLNCVLFIRLIDPFIAVWNTYRLRSDKECKWKAFPFVQNGGLNDEAPNVNLLPSGERNVKEMSHYRINQY